MELLNKKLSLIKDIYALTENLQSVALKESYDEIEILLEKRQDLMDQIDEIDKSIKNSININEDFLKNEIHAQLEKIIEIDNKTKVLLSKKEKEFREKFYEIDIKIKTGNYDMSESEKKPKGYFLNTRN